MLFQGSGENTEAGTRSSPAADRRPNAATEWAFDPRYALLHSTNTGLGLPLSRQLADAIGGTLHLHDRRLLPRGHPLRASGPVPLSAVESVDDRWRPVEQGEDATADDVVVQVGEVHGWEGAAADEAFPEEDPEMGGGAPAGGRMGEHRLPASVLGHLTWESSQASPGWRLRPRVAEPSAVQPGRDATCRHALVARP